MAMKKYSKVENLCEYAKKLIEEGAVIIEAQKKSGIAARRGIPGEKVCSWSVDSDGMPVLEKEAVVTYDECGKISWVAFKIDENGYIITDQHGNTNKWIIEDSVFQEKYVPDSKMKGIFWPVGNTQKFIQLKEGIEVTLWGTEWRVDSNGWINVTDPNDVYVVSERDFQDSYKI